MRLDGTLSAPVAQAISGGRRPGGAKRRVGERYALFYVLLNLLPFRRHKSLFLMKNKALKGRDWLPKGERLVV